MSKTTQVGKVIGEVFPVKELIVKKEYFIEKGIFCKTKECVERVDWEETRKKHETVLKDNLVIPKDSELLYCFMISGHPIESTWVGLNLVEHLRWKYQVIKKIKIDLPYDPIIPLPGICQRK